MRPATATLDAIDCSFLRRLADRPPARSIAASPRPATPAAVEAAAVAVVSPPVVSDIAATIPETRQPHDPGPATPLVERLLRAAPQAWEAIARRIEDAHRDGAAVIAVAGTRRGEGRTTAVACLARTLLARGRRVEVVDKPPSAWSRGFGCTDGPIVLVDAGVWFPGGPLRRASLERAALGCDAAILVRRADQPPCAARGNAIEAIGLKVLGEVLTMVPPAGTAGGVT